MFDDLNELLASAKDVEITGDGEYTELPEGEYNATIENVSFGESQAGNLKFEWEFIITDGDYAKRHHWKYNTLTSPENMKRLLTELEKFGIDTETMETINKGLPDLIGVPVTIKISRSTSKTTGTVFTNTHVNPVE